MCNRVTVNVSQSWSRVIWRASRGGIEHGKGKEKYAFTLLDSNCQDRGRIPRSTGKTRKFSFEPPFIFSLRAPHLFTFRSPPGSFTRRKEKIEHPLNFLFPWGHSRRPLERAFLIIFDSLEMSAGQRDVSKRPFNSSPIDRDSIISDRIHIWRYNLVSISEFRVKMSPRPSRKILLY